MKFGFVSQNTTAIHSRLVWNFRTSVISSSSIQDWHDYLRLLMMGKVVIGPITHYSDTQAIKLDIGCRDNLNGQPHSIIGSVARGTALGNKRMLETVERLQVPIQSQHYSRQWNVVYERHECTRCGSHLQRGSVDDWSSFSYSNTLEIPTELDLSFESNLLVLSDMYSCKTMHAIEMRALDQSKLYANTQGKSRIPIDYT